MRKAISTALAALLLIPAGGASAANFNDVLPGARAMGMGMAYNAISDEPYGMFYNPAGLAGIDLPQMGISAGRMISSEGLLSHETMVYARPLPIMPGATVGAAFFSLRQANGAGDKDELLMHFSDSLWVPRLYLNKPLLVGANFKVVNIDSRGGGPKFGLGFDGGAIIDSGKGLRMGVSLTDLTTPLGVPNPSLNLGAAYHYAGWMLLAADLRVRDRLTEFLPGVELEFYEKLLKVRLGKGQSLNGVGQIALGLGADFSPLFIDVGMAVPVSGFNRPGGGYQLTLTYKFGAPSFYGRFVGVAARQAEDLRGQISELENKRQVLNGQVSSAETDRNSLDAQKRALEDRVTELQQRVRDLEFKHDREAYDAAHAQPAPPPAPVPAPKPAPEKKPLKAFRHQLPLQYKVQPGDTLRDLARTYYGDSSLWEQIYDANPDKVERGLPVEGAILTIPVPHR